MFRYWYLRSRSPCRGHTSSCCQELTARTYSAVHPKLTIFLHFLFVLFFETFYIFWSSSFFSSPFRLLFLVPAITAYLQIIKCSLILQWAKFYAQLLWRYNTIHCVTINIDICYLLSAIHDLLFINKYSHYFNWLSDTTVI